MKPIRHRRPPRPGPPRRPRRDRAGIAPDPELARLHTRLAAAEDMLRAIRRGEVDSLVVTGRQGPQIFTLQGAEHAYRVLIESMNEGALTLTKDKMILYANQRFARMVRCPLEQVIGGSFRRFLSAEDRALLRPLMKRAARSGSKIEVQLRPADGAPLPAQLSIRPLAGPGAHRATFGLVVTDMTEARHTEELLRALTHRVVQVQEAERASVALELHDNITQLLIAVQFSSQALATKLSTRDGPAKREAIKLRTLLGHTAEAVERISRHLRPGILDQLGLFAVLESTCAEFAARTGVAVRLTGAPPDPPLPPETGLAFYRILQEALKNVEQHAGASHVTVRLRQLRAFVELAINDNGIGFNSVQHAARRKGKGCLGLLGMHERAALVGGVLTVRSGRQAGTEVMMRLPLAPDIPAADTAAA